MQNFRLIVHIVLHGCGLHYNVLSGLSVKHNYALPRKKTSLLEFIGAMVSEFRFFMRLRTLRTELKGLTKKLSIPSRYVCRYGLHYNGTDDIRITRSKRVNEKIILRYTVQDNDQFPCKSSGSWFIRMITDSVMT